MNDGSVCFVEEIHTVDHRYYQGNKKVQSIRFSDGLNLNRIPNGYFAKCINLQEFHCPSSVSIIDCYAFEGCKSLKAFIIDGDASLVEIRTSAFKGCFLQNFPITKRLSLEKSDLSGIMSFGENYSEKYAIRSGVVMSLDEKMLFGCSGESERIEIPSSIEVIHSFITTAKEICIERHSKLIKISDGAFSASLIERISLVQASSLSEIPSSCFKDCQSLREFKCPSSVVAVRDCAFKECSLTAFVLSEDSRLKFIGRDAFKACSVRDFRITENFSFEDSDLTGIISFGENQNRNYIFDGQTVMSIDGKTLLSVFGEGTSVCIPSSVEVLHSRVFHGKFAEVSLAQCSNLSMINSDTFEDCFINKLKLPCSVNDISGVNSEFINAVEFEVGNPNFEFLEGIILSSDNSIYWRFFQNSKKIVVPAFIQKIESRCFWRNATIETVSFEECSEISELCNEAFAESSINSIVLPDSLRILGTKCFWKCKSLEYVYIDEMTQLEVIGESCFELCAMRLPFYPVSGNVSETQGRIPRSITELGNSCFKDCRQLKEVLFEAEIKLNKLPESCFERTSIETICVPCSIREIGKSCFQHCNQLCKISFEDSSELSTLRCYCMANTAIEKICLPSTVVEIEHSSFASCSKLLEFRFETGAKIKSLEENLFSNTPNVKVFLPKSVERMSDSFISVIYTMELEPGTPFSMYGNRIFDSNHEFIATVRMNIAREDEVIISPGTELDSSMFMNNNKVKSVIFHPDWQGKELCESLFYNSSISHIVIPKSIQEIKSLCFSFCGNLKQIEFEPESELRDIAEVAFFECAIEKVIIPANVTVINDSAFHECRNLKDVQFEKGSKLIAIHNGAFSECAFERFTVPCLVECIDENAFSRCTNLKYVEFEHESQLKMIKAHAFSHSSLEKIVIPCLVEHIGNEAFARCTNLKIVEFEDGSHLRTIGEGAFAETALVSISIPDSVVEIGAGCFRDTDLIECNLNETSELEILGTSVYNNLSHLFIPPRLVIHNGDSLSGINKVTVSPHNHRFDVIDHFLTSLDLHILYGCFGSLGSVKIPKVVRVVNTRCFKDMKSLRHIEFEDASELEIVQEFAFYGTSVSRLSFPRNLSELGHQCLCHCEDLMEVSFDDGCPLKEIGYICDQRVVMFVPANVSKINGMCLRFVKDVKISERNKTIVSSNKFVYSCSGELFGYFGNEENIVIPKEVTIIDNTHFSGSQEVISISFEAESQLRRIGKSTFKNCKSLKSVSFENVSFLEVIDEDAFYGCSSLSFKIPRTVQFIGRNAFNEVPNVSIEEGSKCVLDYDVFILNRERTTLLGFYETNKEMKVLQIPWHIEKVSKECFMNYRQLCKVCCEEETVLEVIDERSFCASNILEIEIPASVVKVGKMCFYECSYLRQVIFHTPSKLKAFEESTFYKSHLKTITIPASIEELQDQSFAEINELTCVSLEDNSSLICIRDCCFKGCTKLEMFEFDKCKKLRYIHKEAFEDTKLSSVTLYGRFEFVSKSAFGNQCKVMVGDIEDNSLSEWVKTRQYDFYRRREQNFYYGHDFERGMTLGHGSFGNVYLVENRFTGETYAVKEIFAVSSSFEREKNVMLALDHPCIVSLKGFSSSTLCMEFVSGGTLEDAISSQPEWFNATQKSIIVVGIACGMEFIHSRNVMHRDLKPANILLSSSHETKVSDFGISRFEDDNEFTRNTGTTPYMAPELYTIDHEITNKIDVFSFGVILYEIVEGHAAFDMNLSQSILKSQITSGDRPSFSSNTKHQVRELIEVCWATEPDSRPTFEDIISELHFMNFDIVPGTDTKQVEQYFKMVRRI